MTYNKKGLPGSLTETVNKFEAELIKKALDAAKGNSTHAAEILKIKRTTLVMKRKIHGFTMKRALRRGQP